MINVVDLFSGYGGIARALSPWFRTIAYCEIDPDRQGYLLSEMQRGRIDRAPIWDDVRTMRKETFGCKVGGITGGWPCTGHSRAGSRKGLENDESALAKELVRVVCELRPGWGFFENVPGVLDAGSGADWVFGQLAKAGYMGRYGSLSCYDVAPNAWHQRERVWIAIADSYIHRSDQTIRSSEEQRTRGPRVINKNESSRSASNPYRERLQGWMEPEEAWPTLPFVTAPPSAHWSEGVPEPTLQRKVDGPAAWRSQIECIGGGVVPQVAREAFRRLLGL